MYQRLLAFFIAMAILLCAGVAMAGTVDEVLTFGYTPERQRQGTVEGAASYQVYEHRGGESYSQPLILSGDRWGGDLAGKWLIITVEGNNLYGFITPEKEVPIEPSTEVKQLTPLWKVKLSGTTPTKSHPTYHEYNGRKYIYIGTYTNQLNIIDITDFKTVFQNNLSNYQSQYITDVTSAPLVLTWKGPKTGKNHQVLVFTSGNTCKVFLITDPHEAGVTNDFYIDAASYGRTSSSPAPVNGGTGFAIGVDQGRSKGQLRIYYLDDILGETENGQVTLKSKTARVAKTTNAGLAASFSVHGDVIYFGDTQSNVYAFNTATNTQVWANKSCRGIFSNRSPAATETMIYFPAVGDKGKKGKLLAIDRATGKTEWVKDFDSRAQTAPAVLNFPNGPMVLEGTSKGDLFILAADGSPVQDEKLAPPINFENKYGSGIAGEISAVGDTAVLATQYGSIVIKLADINFQAISIDAGIPAGVKVKPGESYTGTAKFKYAGTEEVAWIGIGVFANSQYLRLIDENGNELPKLKFRKERNGPLFEMYYLQGLKPGEERIVAFDYTVPSSQLTLTAAINLNMEPVMIASGEATFEDNSVSISPLMDLQNLIAKITSHPESAPAGESITVAGQLTNEGTEPVNTTVRWSVNGNTVYEGPVTVDKTRDLSLPLSMPSSDASVVLEVNPGRNQPPGESSWADNRDSITINLAAARPQGGGDLTLTPNPARWWEMVTATLKPPAPTPPKGTLTSWSITSAKLTYPKKHPDWTFGHPLDPVGTVTVNMSTGGHASTVEFRQDWSNYGSNVYDIIEQRLIPGPTDYPITATYKIQYEYEYTIRHRDVDYWTDSDGNRHRDVDIWYETKTGSGTDTGTASAVLTVNGTSVLPRAH